MPRLPLVDPKMLTPAQADVYKAIASGPRGRVGGPFAVLLHSPGLAQWVEKVGAYLRYESQLPARLRELAITVVAAHWKADTEWNTHAPLALKHGVPTDVMDDIGKNLPPRFSDEADCVAYNYARELLASSNPSDATFQAAHRLLGNEGIVDLTGVVGYYSMLAMMLNSAQVRPANANIPWRTD